MTVQAAIIARLGSLPAVVALVGTRIYLDRLPQTPRFPAIRVQLISTQQMGHLRGVNKTRRSRVQVDHIAAVTATDLDPAATVQTLSALTHGPGDGAALCGWRGTVDSPPSIEILNVQPFGEYEDYDAEELRQYRNVRDYIVWWKG